MKDLKLFFSLVSGDMYYIEPDEIKNLNKSQIPLLKKPNTSCKKCFGRLYVGFDIKKKYYIPCPRCMQKCVDWIAFKENEVVVEAPKLTNEIADHDFIKAVEELKV